MFYHPVQYSNLKKIIKDFALKNNLVVKDIEYIYLFNLFAKMNFNVYSKGTKYLIYAISECYRNLDLLDGKLSVIYKLIENHFNTNSVSSSIRSALYHFNNNKDHIAIKELSSRFNERANISPKYFLEVVTTYVYYEKNKE